MKIIAKFLSIVFVSTVTFTACEKEENEPTQQQNTTSACDGGNGFCMNYGGIEKSGNASLMLLNNNKIRVYWESGSSANFEQVELDIYGLVEGDYDVNDLAIPGESAFLQYFSMAKGVVNPAYGTITVTKIDTINGLSGIFTVTMNDSTKITNGVFTNIVK